MHWRKVRATAFTGVAALGTASLVVGCGGSTGVAQGSSSKQATGSFNWQRDKGTTINVLFDKHPYADAIIQQLPQFEKQTGITVKYTEVPEDSYFDKVSTDLSTHNGNPDVFMTGSYQMWEYASAGYIQKLDPYINNSSITNSNYDISDFIPGVLNGDKWDLKAGDPAGTGSQWAIPMGFEMYDLEYNKQAFAKLHLSPPKTLQELYQDAVKLNGWNGPGSYGIAVRGSRSWATIHPGYMSAYTNAGAKDFTIQNGKLVSGVDSPQSIQLTDLWTKMIKQAGPPSWSTYTWYQASADLGAGKAAMLYDADIAAFFQNQKGASKEAGNIAWAPAPLPTGATTQGSNEWIWSLAMNNYSKNKDAAWLFMQWATGKEHDTWGALNADLVNPARQSIWKMPQFQARLKDNTGYYSTFEDQINNTKIEFTPQPDFFETTTDWAAELQKIESGQISASAGMKELAASMNKTVVNVKAGQ
ncbi:ABC transporter substrate-binding protein [Alicyclobacillus dauci]|uniref:Sugar ABC transporter substrate-binding protein n=1 Tax=Alicyclobacillus dauci TaxID=1475485 RepID=A0ABY6Z7I7_9BACL|nr:sugar ABC transporter substrate-binding protein [Alicyclobacillus dauci]WAH38854.1 sugar ABC transporter substrate-binding protein [Alicyclobacillus dauci]